MGALEEYAGELVLATYGPLIDKIGTWCLGTIAFYFFCRFVLWFWKQL